MSAEEVVPVLDQGYVELVETWGSDERIIESARMSTDKGFKGWGPYPCPGCETAKDTGCPMCKGKALIEGDEKLLKFLYTHKHMTPFEMAGATFEIQAPIFVFREWHRHRTQSYNEMSGRYTELPDKYYVPSLDRLMGGMQSTKNKQGSHSGFDGNQAKEIAKKLKDAYDDARDVYEELLAKGVARELARLVVPVAQYSRMRASANLRNWLGFLTLRTDPAAQSEIREYAWVVEAFLTNAFPRTMALFSEGK